MLANASKLSQYLNSCDSAKTMHDLLHNCEVVNTLRKQSPSQKGIETHETGCIFMHFGHVKLKIVIFLTGNHGNGRE